MSKRVLVVDDDHLVADTLCLIFKVNGFQAEACYSAAEGLECARSFAPQLLLCDVTMPDETGLQLAEKVHREMPGCKVLLLTAYSSNAIKVELYSEQMNRPLKLLNKPCHPEVLLEEAERLLRTA
jgi:DNA-binding response OmpR family regulator